MCLIVFSWQPDSPTPLVVSANRDEFYARQTSPLHVWPDTPELIAGKDEQQGGTWLGISSGAQAPRFAAVTNIRTGEPEPPNQLSRGQLPLDFLTGHGSAQVYVERLASTALEYGRFNLLCCAGDELWYARNHPRFCAEKVSPGLHVLSNAHLDTPWPKTTHALAQLRDWLDSERDLPLTHLLTRQDKADEHELPNTGVPLEWERLLSSPFILSPTYGTRCSTSVVCDVSGARIEEVSWDNKGKAHATQSFKTPR